MNIKILGIRIGTVLLVIFCVIAAVVFWMFSKYSVANVQSFVNLIDAINR